jgi:hypothetical protein
MKRRHLNVEGSTDRHAAHFIGTIRDGEKPNADCLIGHRSTIVPLLGNIALEVGRKLRWDSVREDFVGDPEASRLLGRKARKPWDMISA